MYTNFRIVGKLLPVAMLGAVTFCTSVAAAADVAHIELRRLFEPTNAELTAESNGRIYIYEGLRDRYVERALDEEFERVDSMMFIRTRKTDESGKVERDEQTGAAVVEDDGC